MRLSRLLLALLTTVPVLDGGSAASAANLVLNPSFDDDIDGWVTNVNNVLQHGTLDERGSLNSGSIVVRAAAAGNTHVDAFYCVPVAAGETYVFGAAARFDENQPANAAFVNVSWFATANCTGATTDSVAPVLPYFMRLRGAWGPTQRWDTAPPGVNSAYLVLRANAVETPQAPLEVAFDNAFFVDGATCESTLTVLCLSQGRFRVLIEWATHQGDNGFGKAIALTSDSGYFWFFNPENVEVVTKLLDACPTQFATFWFFAAGLTNVHTVIRVHDTGTDTGRTYTNPQQTPFAPIQDTEAFATCP